ncbi:MAG: hypothetical protein ACHQAY_01355 [Hyphomicrobiales bacterium]
MAMFGERDLEAARRAGVLSEESYLKLAGFLAARGAPPTSAAPPPAGDADREPRFDVTHVLWYAGALIVMTAMGLFSSTAFAAMGGGALIVTGLVYAVAFVLVGSSTATSRAWRPWLARNLPPGVAALRPVHARVVE